jgi:hypothetical protein
MALPASSLKFSGDAGLAMQALKRMAFLGMNIITVVHQPRYSIFTLFDTVMLLGKGGR